MLYSVPVHWSPQAQQLRLIAGRCGPDIARVVPWGTSGKGLELLGLELYAGPANEAERPLFKYVGNVHGDEPSGRQLLLALAEHLCMAHAGKVPAVLRLLGAVGLFIIPTMNPDGFDAHIRENRWGVVCRPPASSVLSVPYQLIICSATVLQRYLTIACLPLVFCALLSFTPGASLLHTSALACPRCSHHLDLNRNFPDPIQSPGHDLRVPLGSEQPETLAMMNLTLSRR